MARRKREVVAHFRWQDDRPADEFFRFHGRLFLRGEQPHSIEAYHSTASLSEDPRRDRAHGVATIVLPSRSDTSRTACLCYGTIDRHPELIAAMCKQTLEGAWAA